MDRRREDLGRNRPGPPTRSTMGTLFLGIVLLSALGVIAYLYFTRPQRVYGAKTFDCAVTEIEWRPVEAGGATPKPGLWAVSGCGEEEIVRCDDRVCRPLDDETHPGTRP